MNPDQENLLTSTDREQITNHSIRCNSNTLTTSKTIRKNLLLLVLSLLIGTCLTIYLYLNLVAIDGYQSDQARYKPLSRRKPILDHESIFSDSGPSMIRLSDLLAHCLVGLKVAGQEVVRLSLQNNPGLEHVGSKGKTLEGADDVITGADLKSHKMILNTIKDSYRRLRVVSEEDTTKAFDGIKLEDDLLPIKRREFAQMLRESLHEIEDNQDNHNTLINQHETLVWIDPLDATKEYSENLTEYVTLMACVVHKSLPIAGIILKPFQNLTYWSVREEANGSTSHSRDLSALLDANRRKVQSSKDKQVIQEPKVIVSRSHAGHVDSLLHRLYGEKASIIAAGGSGYKTLELLAGNVDAYIHVTHIKKWDICAPQAILNSVHGGNLTDMTGAPVLFGDPHEKVVTKGLIATVEPTLHRELVESLGDSQKSNQNVI